MQKRESPSKEGKVHMYDTLTICQKTTQLKKMLTSKDLEFIMEAHNGLSAKIVQEAGNTSVTVEEERQ